MGNDERAAGAAPAVDEGAGPEDMEAYFTGTGEERIRKWLQPNKHPDGRLKSGDWMEALLPHLSLHSTSAAQPHPRATFVYTVQAEHCNRMQNLHGGCAATLFDFCTTLPLSLVNRPGFWFFLGVSRSLNVTYLRPIPKGETVLVECEITQIGRRLCSLRGVMRRRRDGLVMATCAHDKFNTDPPGPEDSKL